MMKTSILISTYTIMNEVGLYYGGSNSEVQQLFCERPYGNLVDRVTRSINGSVAWLSKVHRETSV